MCKLFANFTEFLSPLVSLFSARDIKIFTLLESIQEELKDQKRLLRMILAKSATQDIEVPALSSDIQFPLMDMESMLQLDEKLDNKETMTSLVSYYN